MHASTSRATCISSSRNETGKLMSILRVKPHMSGVPKQMCRCDAAIHAVLALVAPVVPPRGGISTGGHLSWCDLSLSNPSHVPFFHSTHCNEEVHCLAATVSRAINTYTPSPSVILRTTARTCLQQSCHLGQSLRLFMCHQSCNRDV